MGMKFHKLYVALVNPLGILLFAILAVVMLIVALDAGLIAEESGIPYLSGLEAGTALWTLFGLAAGMFLLLMTTEFLLVTRKKAGIVTLSVTLLLGAVSTAVSYVLYSAQTPCCSIAVAVAASVLILPYYWKRYKIFT